MKRRLILPDRSLYVSRRKFLSGLGAAASLFAAPSIVRVEAFWQSRGEGINQSVSGGGGLGLQTNLGSFFSLDNTLADSVGAVTDLTNNNVVTFVTPPGAGLAAVTNCANFVAASSQSLTHADAAGLNVAGVSFSLQAWVYYTTANFYLTKNSGGFGAREYNAKMGFVSSGNQAGFNTGDFGNFNSGTNLSGSTWLHIVDTYNVATRLREIYVNGSFANSSTASTNHPAGTSTFCIGADSGGAGNFFGGNIALVGTWVGRVLSAGDVTLLYNGGAGLSYAAMA